MNFGLVGPNGAGKSTLLQKLVEADKTIIPFSFSNVPIVNNSKRDEWLPIRKNRGLVSSRIEDLERKWGAFYSRSLFSGENVVVMDEIFLTKLLRKVPTSPSQSFSFIDDFQNYIEKILDIESNYIDRYIYVLPSQEQWTSNILRRPTQATNEMNISNRFKIQTICLEAYLSKLSRNSYITIGNFAEKELTLIYNFIKNSNS